MTVEEASSGTVFLAADDGGGVVVERGGSAGGCGVSASDFFGFGASLGLFPVTAMALSTFSSKSDEVVVPETDESPKVSNSALGPGSLSDDLLLRYFTPSSDDHLDEWALRANLPEDDRFVRLRVRSRAGIDAEAIIGEEAVARRLWSSLLHLRVRVGELFFILARRSRASTGLGLFVLISA